MNCKKCGDEIRWSNTRSGKALLCEPGLVPYKADIRGRERVVTQDGDTVNCVLFPEPEEITDVGWPLHYGRCRGR